METLKTLREEHGKSRQEVAAALGVSVQAISNYENNIRKVNFKQGAYNNEYW